MVSTKGKGCFNTMNDFGLSLILPLMRILHLCYTRRNEKLQTQTIKRFSFVPEPLSLLVRVLLNIFTSKIFYCVAFVLSSQVEISITF